MTGYEMIKSRYNDAVKFMKTIRNSDYNIVDTYIEELKLYKEEER